MKIEPGTKINVVNSDGSAVIASGTAIEIYWKTYDEIHDEEEPTEHVRYFREIFRGTALPEGHPDRMIASCAMRRIRPVHEGI